MASLDLTDDPFWRSFNWPRRQLGIPLRAD